MPAVRCIQVVLLPSLAILGVIALAVTVCYVVSCGQVPSGPVFGAGDLDFLRHDGWNAVVLVALSAVLFAYRIMACPEQPGEPWALCRDEVGPLAHNPLPNDWRDFLLLPLALCVVAILASFGTASWFDGYAQNAPISVHAARFMRSCLSLQAA